MTDLIRRSVLIDEICRSSIYKWSVEEDQGAHNWALNIINSQPSVESSKGDLISRADAIDACCRGWNNTAEDCIRNIKALPSADADAYTRITGLMPDAVQGEWKHTITGQPYCSNCEYVFGEDEEFSPFWKYCPMCGARMENTK